MSRGGRSSVSVWSLVGCLGLAAVMRADSPKAWTDDLSPIAAGEWTYARAAHLLERASFGATPEEIARVAAMTPSQAVDWLVDYEKTDNGALVPFDESGIWDPGMDPFPPSRAEAVRLARGRGEGLGEKVLPAGAQRRLQPVVDKFFYSLYANRIETDRLGLWWANRMLATRRPLEEKLTLFWHGHFATGENKVRDYRMMLAAESDVPGERIRQIPRFARRAPQRSRHARVSGQRRERQGSPQRELRARAPGAVHDGRRQLLRARRAGSRSCVYGVDQRRPGIQAGYGTARRRSEDVSRSDWTARRRGHHRYHPRTAGDRRVRGRKALPVFRTRGDRRGRQGGVGTHLSRQWLSGETAVEADLPLERFFQRAFGGNANQESRAPRRLDVQEDGAHGGADDS